ncbi:MAG: hypothetical protein QM569_15040, partial [Acidovorax sp.]|uniref:hypothetical protein n=1 Tax=Acidovorax sp. TaxID=1872122 RepID=UPI0039E65E04
PMGRALAAARDAARARLLAGAHALGAALPADGVLFHRIARWQGRGAVRVLFVWPGTLLVLSADGEVIRECDADAMHDEAPAEAALLASATRGKPLARCVFQPPQGIRLRAVLDADGVVRVRAARGGELLAESEPGQPTVLRAGFNTTTPQDLSPRLS